MKHCETCPLAIFIDNLSEGDERRIMRQAETARDAILCLSGAMEDAGPATLDFILERDAGLRAEEESDGVTDKHIAFDSPDVLAAGRECERRINQGECSEFTQP